MKKLIILLMLMSISSSCFATNLPTDKVAHFGVGYIVNDQLKKNTKMTFLERLGYVALIAGAKEATDSKWDWNDFGATMAGCLVVEIHF